MKKTFSLKIHDHIHDVDGKRYLNEKMFGEIAPRYDLICRIMSFNRDAKWKRYLISRLPDLGNSECVDLACGTGDLLWLLADKYPDGQVTGVDITDEMLEFVRQRNKRHNVWAIKADMCKLPMYDGSVDIVTGGYALRNAPELKVAIREVRRVLKPGGYAGFLDFSKPASGVIQKLEYWVLKCWTGFWGFVFHRNPEVYSYIAESLKLFPDSSQLKTLIEREGFQLVESKKLFFGVAELLVFRKI